MYILPQAAWTNPTVQNIVLFKKRNMNILKSHETIFVLTLLPEYMFEQRTTNGKLTKTRGTPYIKRV